MEQTASRSMYKFIPRPIEQQLATYQPGNLLDHYQSGWKRNAKGDRTVSWRLPGLFLTPIGLVGTYFSMRITYDTIQMSGLIVPGLLFIILLPITILLIGVVSLFHASPFCLVVFSEGLVYAKKRRITIVRWSEIAWYEETIIHTSIGATFHKYKIHTHAGKNVRWKIPEGVIQNLTEIINKHIAE